MTVATEKSASHSSIIKKSNKFIPKRKRIRKKLAQGKILTTNETQYLKKKWKEKKRKEKKQQKPEENKSENNSEKLGSQLLINDGQIVKEELELLLQKPPNEVLLFIMNSESGFQEILQKDSSPEIIIVVRIITIALNAVDLKEKRKTLIALLLESKIFSTQFDMLIKKCPPNMLPLLLGQIGLLDITNCVVTELSTATRKQCRGVVRFCKLLDEMVRTHELSDEITEKIQIINKTAGINCLNRKTSKNEKQQKMKSDKKSKRKINPPSYRKMTIIPDGEELLSQEEVYLRPVLERGSYFDLFHYLEVHFRLMREDFVCPLRKAVQEYKRLYKTEKLSRYGDAKFYRNVKITKDKTKGRNNFYKLVFDISNVKEWDRNESFKSGTLFCISANNFDTIYFGVVMLFEEDDDLPNHVTIIQVKNMNKYFSAEVLTTKHFIVFESPAFLEAYYHVLKVLQSLQGGKLPFEDHFVRVKKFINHPSYLTPGLKYTVPIEDVSSETINSEELPVFELDKWPHPSVLGLDISQMKALQHALSSSLALIQGPPGTGKTFIGLKILHTLLMNKHKLDKKDQKPILVVCFTNHALDQFLEGVLNFNQNLVRVGGQSMSDKLVDFNLRVLCSNYFSNEFQNEIDIMRQDADKWKEIKKNLNSDIFLENMFNFPEPDNTLLESLKLKSDEFESKSSLYAWLNLTFDKAIAEPNLLTFMNTENQSTCGEKVTYKMLNSRDSIKIKDLGEIKTFFQFQKKFKKSVYFTDLVKSAASKKLLAQSELKEKNIMTDEELQEIQDIWELTLEDRWKLYRRWLLLFTGVVSENIQSIEKNIDKKFNSVKIGFKDRADNILKSADVIGMTTTGAARNYKLLKRIGCQIVLVEEAAEVFESHIIASLNPKTKHLILIGDHQQLRPIPTVYNLAKEYKFDVSLFERLVNNKLPHVTLEQQHRMRPEISSIARNHFYPNLRDHPCVSTYPSVVGMEKNIFFMNHAHPEAAVDQQSPTFKNEFEADFLLHLSCYLLQQGYTEDQICILAMYSGQTTHINRLIQTNANFSKNIRVTTVDNFQGEESDIVLLSLVRSNSLEVIGFLRQCNRITVALTRAKQGLYVVGNFGLLAANSDYWNRIVTELKNKHWLHNSLTVVCPFHPENIRSLDNSKKFKKIAPDGFCNKVCGFVLQCGHACIKTCHVGNHRCQKSKKKMVRLPCGHKICKPCDNNIKEFMCRELVTWMFQICGHMVAVECYLGGKDIVCNRCTLQYESSLFTHFDTHSSLGNLSPNVENDNDSSGS